MSCFVNTPGGSGVDLSSLTSGELWLLSQLTGGIWYNTGQRYASGNNSLNQSIDIPLGGGCIDNSTDNKYSNQTGTDWSNIQSFSTSFIFYCYNGSNSTARFDSFTIQLADSTGQTTNLSYPFVSRSVYGSKNWYTDTLSQTLPSFTSPTRIYQFRFWYNVAFSPTWQGTMYASFHVASFTTTDGKTHTATNLNY